MLTWNTKVAALESINIGIEKRVNGTKLHANMPPTTTTTTKITTTITTMKMEDPVVPRWIVT